MFNDLVVQITDDTFDAEVMQSHIPVLVDFWADWCEPCRAIAPSLEEVADKYAGRLTVAKLHVDANPRTVAQFKIHSIPTLILFYRGKPIERIVGVIRKEELLSRIRNYLGGETDDSDYHQKFIGG